MRIINTKLAHYFSMKKLNSKLFVVFTALFLSLLSSSWGFAQEGGPPSVLPGSVYIEPAMYPIYPRADPKDFSEIIWDVTSPFVPDTRPLLEQHIPKELMEKLTPETRKVYENYKEVSSFLTPGISYDEGLIPDSACLPIGMPGQVVNAGAAMQFVVSEHAVAILMEINYQSRLIHMNQEHPENIEPSWTGHSVGWWDGDELVIDTVGYTDESSMVAVSILNSEKLHTIERYTLVDDGRKLLAKFYFEDPQALTEPWIWERTYYPSGTQEIFTQDAPCQEGGSNRPFALSTPDTEGLG